MHALGDGKKKLIVAFHFHLSNVSGWNCDECRSNNLERTRNCGWLYEAPGPGSRPVWARGDAFTTICPKSALEPRSMEWLEAFAAAKLAGCGGMESRPAKDADAFLVLEGLVRAERRMRLEGAGTKVCR